MSVTFHIPGPLRPFTNNASHVEIEGSPATVAEALRGLMARHPGMRFRLLNEQGEVREHLNIFVGEESIRYTGGLGTKLENGCEIFIIPAVSGG
jgi:sulfur-carrier protein